MYFTTGDLNKITNFLKKQNKRVRLYGWSLNLEAVKHVGENVCLKAWVQIPAPLPASCVTLDKVLNLTEHQFPVCTCSFPRITVKTNTCGKRTWEVVNTGPGPTKCLLLVLIVFNSLWNPYVFRKILNHLNSNGSPMLSATVMKQLLWVSPKNQGPQHWALCSVHSSQSPVFIVTSQKRKRKAQRGLITCPRSHSKGSNSVSRTSSVIMTT